MPHDKNGNLLVVGDLVTVECEVVLVNAGEEYCNVTLKTVELMHPYTDEAMGRSTITLNARQVVKLEGMSVVSG